MERTNFPLENMLQSLIKKTMDQKLRFAQLENRFLNKVRDVEKSSEH